MILGVLIRRTREQRGWSTTDLAAAADTTPSLVEHLEAGRGLPNWGPVLRALLKVLDITPAVVWRHALADAASARGPVEFGWAPRFMDVAVVAGPVPDVQVLDTLLTAATGSVDRPPGLLVVRNSQWSANGEYRALDVAAELRGIYGPSYQVRTGTSAALVWDPSLITLTRWSPDPFYAEVTIPAGTELALTTDPTHTPSHGAGVLVIPLKPGPPPSGVSGVKVRAISDQLWVCPALHNAIVPNSNQPHTRYTPRCTHVSFLLPLMPREAQSWN